MCGRRVASHSTDASSTTIGALQAVGSQTGAGTNRVKFDKIKAWAGTRKSESKVGTVAEIENTRRRTIATGTTFHWIEATRCSKNTIRNSRDC